MKNLFVVHLVALGILSVSQQQASAWTNIKFGVGLNFSWQSDWFSGHGRGDHSAHMLPPYVIAPIFYQPSNPDFFVSPPSFGESFVAPAPTPVPTTHHSNFGGAPYYQNTAYPSYTYPTYYGR